MTATGPMPWDQKPVPPTRPRPTPPPPPAPRPREKPEIWTAEKVITTEFPPIKWVVPDYLPVGLATLGGRPKQGKSFLGLQLAISVGSGGIFLGRRVERGRSLYIALEDNARRMQQRLADMHAMVTVEIDMAFMWPPLNSADGIAALEEYVREHKPRMVIIDTLTRAFTGRVDWDSVSETTAHMGIIQHLALINDCTILTIDHHKKTNGQDADEIDDILGSTGKSAVCDTVWGLYRKRGERDARLRVTGRDVPDCELQMSWDQTTCCWQMAGPVKAGSVQEDIIEALRENDAMTTTEIASVLGRAHQNISVELAELQNKGLVTKQSQSRYAPWKLRNGNGDA